MVLLRHSGAKQLGHKFQDVEVWKLLSWFISSVVVFVFLDFVNAARQVFSIQLDDHSLSDSAVQFAIQDVNNTEASVAAKNNTFEEVGVHSHHWWSITTCDIIFGCFSKGNFLPFDWNSCRVITCFTNSMKVKLTHTSFFYKNFSSVCSITLDSSFAIYSSGWQWWKRISIIDTWKHWPMFWSLDLR